MITMLATLAAGVIYRSQWLKLRPNTVPTGFGVFTCLPILLALAIAVPSSSLIYAGIALALSGFVYWIDDASHLSAKIRIFIALLTGLGMTWLALPTHFDAPLHVMLPVILFFGVMNVGLVNMINFYDGADLNLAAFVMIQAVFLAVHLPLGHWVHLGAVALFCFALAFSFFNRRPETVYFGDSGCFLFAGFLTLMAVSFFFDPQVDQPSIFIPLALPFLDVAFVMTVRILRGHDLLSRNYMHIYQRLQRRFADRRYLAPQVLNAGICYGFVVTLEALGATSMVAVGMAIIAVTPMIYFGLRAVYLSGPVEGPLQEVRKK